MQLDCPSMDQWHKGVPRSVRVPTLIGAAVLLVWGGGFGLWAALAPLDGAVVTSGSFVATGQNKIVQHLEGGIVRDLLVKEGELVEADVPLLRLDETAAKAKLRRLSIRRYRLVSMRARLEAEINGGSEFVTPLALGDEARDPEVEAILQRQRTELRARRAKLAVEEEVLKREIAGLRESIKGYESQLGSTRERLSLFGEELKDKSALLARQLIRKTDVLTLQRAEAGLSGELGELSGRVADARERIARADQQIAQLQSASVQKSVEELRTTETELDDVLEQIRAAQDVMNRIEVRSPVRGIVVKLNHHTRGGVIAPGAVILELLPVNDELLIETRVAPTDISYVKEGQEALVRLTALNQRVTPMVEGRVVYLSADAVTESESKKGEPSTLRRTSFVVRVALDQQSAHDKLPGFRATPGMPADIFIKTGERTFFEYMLRPVLDSFSRAFRET